MIVDYFRENKIAISYVRLSELKIIYEQFNTMHPGPSSGWVSFYDDTYSETNKIDNNKFRCSNNRNDFEDFTIITFSEFQELITANVSSIDSEGHQLYSKRA